MRQNLGVKLKSRFCALSSYDLNVIDYYTINCKRMLGNPRGIVLNKIFRVNVARGASTRPIDLLTG